MPISAGFKENGKASVVLDKRNPTGRRFALARIMADFLTADDQDRLFPITQALTAREKLQRAFAQEFLCPLASLEEFLGDEGPSSDRIEEAAEYFQVSPLVISRKLMNKGLIDRSELIEYESVLGV